MSELQKLRELQQSWVHEVRRLRDEARLLIAKAELLEGKQIDLDIALDKIERDKGNNK